MRNLVTEIQPAAPGATRRGLGLALALAAALCCGLSLSAAAANFTASLNRTTITLGESAALSLTFEGDAPKEVPQPPPIQNLRITYLGPSSQFSFINGQSSTTVTHNFTVTPQQVGDFTIPALVAVVGGQRLASQPLALKVVKPGAVAASQAGEQLVLLKLALPKKEVYLGETVVAKLQLYLHSSVRNFGNLRLNAFPADGFNLGKNAEGQRRRVQIGNSVYTLVPYAVTLTPIKAGPGVLGPVAVSLIVELASANRRGDPFDPFGMFNRNEQNEITLATEPESVQTLPLPAENQPPDFKGAVGNYTLTVTAGPTNVAVGDPITVRVQISGRGALESLELPDQTAWHDFKTYPPSSKIETADELGIQGTKTFEEIVVPQNSDLKALPPFSFSYFDPERKSYRTLTQPGMALVVRPGGTTLIPNVAAANRAAQDNPPLSQDIVPIKQRLGAVSPGSPPLLERPGFLALQSVPVLALLCSIAWRKRGESLANNPRLRRRRQVAQIVRDGLDDLRRLAAENNSEGFFATLFRLLQEQLGERLNLPASAITEAVIEEHLRPKGVPEATVTAVHELFQRCNLARYAPVKSSQELAALIPRLETVLRELQEVKA
jgi:hypothetical protein